MNILFLGAHTDDIEIGAGATMCSLAKKNGIKVHYRALSKCLDIERNKEIEKDQEKVKSFLNKRNITVQMSNFENRNFSDKSRQIREYFERERDWLNPTVVFTHWKDDIHQDHRVVYEESMRVFRNTSIISYECLRSCPGFSANFYYNLSSDDLADKTELISLYETQRNLNYTQIEVYESLASVRGVESGMKRAEGFSIVKMYGGDGCALLA